MRLDIKDKPLSVFLQAADETSAKCLSTRSPSLELVHEVDELIRLRLWGEDVQLDAVSALLAINSYYSFLGAVRTALSGHFVAIFPLIRHSLECACYAYLLAEKPALGEIWSNRNQSADGLRACRRAFGGAVSDVARSIKGRQQQLGSLVDDLYQASIDFGAHPNTRSIFPNLSINEVTEGTKVLLACLYGEHDLRLQQGLIACAENGIASAFVVALAAKNHSLLDHNYAALSHMYGRVYETIGLLEAKGN